jgi:hypothetical protein
MEAVLSFFRTFELWIYLALGLWGLYSVRKFILAWQDLREAAFGLERETAQSRLNQSAVMLVVLLTFGVVEFVLVSIIAPTFPGASPLPTPTLDLLATPTVTLGPESTPLPGTVISPTLQVTQQPVGSGCVPGQIEISYPTPGLEISDVITITGSASIANFGFYKYEMKRPDESLWLTIQAGDQVVQNGKLGEWDTRRLLPGDYVLSLVVVDNQARSSDPCTVQVRVNAPGE